MSTLEKIEVTKEVIHCFTFSSPNKIPLIAMKNTQTAMIANESTYAKILHHHGNMNAFFFGSSTINSDFEEPKLGSEPNSGSSTLRVVFRDA